MKHSKLLILSLALLIAGCGQSVTPSEVVSTSANTTDSPTDAPMTESKTESNTTEVPTSEATSEKISTETVNPATEADILYCSPEATSFTASGTKEDPMLLSFAVRYSKPGATIVMLNGTYKMTGSIEMSELVEQTPATCPEEGKTLTAEEDGKVILDFSIQKWDSANRGLKVNSDYWTVKDLEVCYAGDNGIYVGGSYNTIDHCVLHDNGDTGLQLGRAASSETSIDEWPSYNLIKNCTSYDNHDPKGEDSDGFACKLTTGVGNVFDGCIAYNNVDDGWDLYTKGDTGPIGPVTLRNCVAFNNGITTGQNTDGVPYGTSNSDGNGFKLGGETIAVPHQVYNCVAFNNLACGFTDNSNPGCIRIENCTSYNNGVRDYDACNIDMCRNVDTSINYYKNIFSYSDLNVDFRTGESKLFNSKDQYKGTAVDSMFYYGRTLLRFTGVEECNYTSDSLRGEIVVPENTPFVSTQIPDNLSNIHRVLRDENGDIKLGDFLKLKDAFVSEMYEGNVSLGADLA